MADYDLDASMRTNIEFGIRDVLSDEFNRYTINSLEKKLEKKFSYISSFGVNFPKVLENMVNAGIIRKEEFWIYNDHSSLIYILVGEEHERCVKCKRSIANENIFDGDDDRDVCRGCYKEVLRSFTEYGSNKSRRLTDAGAKEFSHRLKKNVEANAERTPENEVALEYIGDRSKISYSDLTHAIEYMRYNKKVRWSELEYWFVEAAKNPEVYGFDGDYVAYVTEYCTISCNRIPELEEFLIKNANWWDLHMYQLSVVKERWPAAEHVLSVVLEYRKEYMEREPVQSNSRKNKEMFFKLKNSGLVK